MAGEKCSIVFEFLAVGRDTAQRAGTAGGDKSQSFDLFIFKLNKTKLKIKHSFSVKFSKVIITFLKKKLVQKENQTRISSIRD